MYNKILWIVFTLLTLILAVFFLRYPIQNSGGDIVEYFGMTESLIKHFGLNLTDADYDNLKHSLNPGYFINTQNSDQNGGFFYYMKGRDENRYAVHFPFYSLISLPVRGFLKIFNQNELLTLRMANLILLTIAVYFALRKYTSLFKRIAFLILVYVSPIVSFILWPGPDIYYLSLLMVGGFLFFQRMYISAIILTALASWQSQPLIILSLSFLFYYIYKNLHIEKTDGKLNFSLDPILILKSCSLILLMVVPYIYNYLIFGVLTPWTILNDGWTIINGFGMQNVGLRKLYEQFFDLNIGLFWYAPLILIIGVYYALKTTRKDKKGIFVLGSLILTAIFYQTNPAWNYGTAGYGPTRHILFVIPFLIIILVDHLQYKVKHIVLLGFIVLTQLYALSFNGYLTPDFTNSLRHSVFASFVLDYFPDLYNPTPEIFVDRTNHTDLKYISSAIYKYNGICRKAYILKHETDILKKECGYIPSGYESQLEDEFVGIANKSRNVWTTEATFWPDPESCSDYFQSTSNKPYICMKTIKDMAKYTGISDLNRIKSLPEYPYPGVWVMTKGDPVKITVPPGYIINHYSMDGVYVTYQ